MENGLRRSLCLWDGENPGVITSRQHLKWVHRLGKKRLLTPRLMSVFLPGDKARRDGETAASRCVQGPVITAEVPASKG